MVPNLAPRYMAALILPTSSVRPEVGLAAFLFLARGTDSDDVDRVAFHLEAPGPSLQRRKTPEVLLFNVGDRLALRTHHMVMVQAVQFDSK